MDEAIMIISFVTAVINLIIAIPLYKASRKWKSSSLRGRNLSGAFKLIKSSISKSCKK